MLFRFPPSQVRSPIHRRQKYYLGMSSCSLLTQCGAPADPSILWSRSRVSSCSTRCTFQLGGASVQAEAAAEAAIVCNASAVSSAPLSLTRQGSLKRNSPDAEQLSAKRLSLTRTALAEAPLNNPMVVSGPMLRAESWRAES